MKRTYLYFLLSMVSSILSAQQIPDISYDPNIQNLAYKSGEGPVIFIDEGHNNFHTKDGRYLPFAKLLEKDGYEIKAFQGEFLSRKLNEGKILVIANALNRINVNNWTLPTPSAFTKDEIMVLEKWVEGGGSLFLIADHMPWPGAAADLAAVFGFKFLNGFNFDVVNPAYFWKSNGTVVENAITTGRDSTEVVNQIPRTEGQAFQIPSDAQPILLFNTTSMILLPDTAWQFNNRTPIKSVDGYAQGAFKKFGEGKIVVFGEASMFSAQIGNPGKRKMGMNNNQAQDNYKLLLNIIHWLDGKLE